MKIKRLNNLTVASSSAKVARLRVHNGGVIALNVSACDLMKLKEGDRIEIIQDEERPKDWYLVISNKPEALEMRQYKSNKGLVNQNSAIAKAFIKSLDKGAKSLGLLIGTEPVPHDGEDLWPIITSAIKSLTV